MARDPEIHAKWDNFRHAAQHGLLTHDRDALDLIADILLDPDWAPGMLEDIAAIVTNTGRDLFNLTDEPTWDRH